jgi:anthranilate/para-aminobenzoate synthase component II
MTEQIVILDFGSQYTQVIARRVRECNVYSIILPFNTPAAKIAALKPKGIILSGGPSSVYARNAPLPDRRIFALNLPILGICYGVQLLAQFLGGHVEKGRKREYGKGILTSGILTGTGSPDSRAASNLSPSRRTHRSQPSKTARGNNSVCSFIPRSSTPRAAGK